MLSGMQVDALYEAFYGDQDIDDADFFQRSSEVEYYQNAFMGALDQHTLISMTDKDGRIVYVNDKMCEVTGFCRGELIGENHRIFKSGHHSEDFFEQLWARISSGLMWEGHINNRRKDGGNCWIYTSIAPVFGRENEIVGYISVRTDISRQKQAEEEIKKALELEKKAQKRLMSAINVMSGGVIIYDKEGRVIAANEGLKALYPQLDGLLVPGAPLASLVAALYPDLPPRQLASRVDTILGDTGDEVRILPEGQIVTISRSRAKNGDLIVVNTDITAYVEQEKRLKKQADKLQAALKKEMELNDLQRQFVSMASHEFRTPLAIIDSTAQRLERRKARLDEAELSTRVFKIRRSVQRMTELMESTLSAARMDAGKVQLKISDCHIKTLIEKVCLRQQEIAINHKISWQLEGLPETVKCDCGSIGRVMANLLSNAVKYSPDSPDIHVEGAVAGGDILVHVRDYGLGIDEEDQPRLFERFFRAKTSTGIAGTGIGLNLAKLLVREHGGDIALQSRKGEGSVFTIRLPVAGPDFASETGD